MSRGPSDLARSQREAILKIGLPEKDLELLQNGRLVDTPAVLAMRKSAATITVLSGPPGCGKTTAASAWLWSWVRDPSNWGKGCFGDDEATWKAPGMWTTAARLARMDKYDAGAVDALHKAARLVVDDLGAEYSDAKGFFQSFLDELINERYAGMRPTLITTNCKTEEFKARVGERITDRLREMGRFVAILGPSMRKGA